MSVPLKKLEDQLNCPICMDTYTNPKQLQCNHVCCQKCLVKLMFRDQQGQLILSCPNCRQVTPVPASGVAGLQPAFQINKFLEIVEEHKKMAGASETAESASASHTSHGTVCHEHDGKKVELYCEKCGKTICWKCIKKGEKHHSHEYSELDEAFERYKEEIASALEPLEKQLDTIEESLKALDTSHETISDQRETIKTNIHKTISRLHENLEARETELVYQLDQLTQTKLKSLAAQRDQIETTQAQLNSCFLFIKENLKNQEKALTMKSTTVKQVKELTATFQPDMLEPKIEADMIFSSLEDLKAKCRNYGEVYAAGPPDPAKCCVTGKGVDTAAVGEKSTLILQSRNFECNLCKLSMDSISCELVSEVTAMRLTSNTARRGQSQYEISYQPTIKGRHQLHITVDGHHIRGSPFPVSVRSPADMLGKSILTISGVKGPTGAAVNKKGELVVAEHGSNSVSVFSPSGERLRSIGRENARQQPFKHPIGVAVDAEDNILVTDSDNHRIQKFTTNGDFVTAVGTHSSGPLQFDHPYGIAVSSTNGRVYVTETSRIQILNPDLSFCSTIGTKGGNMGQFKNPRHTACDSNGNVYVVDQGNHRIQVFTADGGFLRLFGSQGKNRGELSLPCGIAIDHSNRIYVSEIQTHRISVFTSEGQFLTSFGSEGEGPRQFEQPQGIAVDCGVVYVCEKTCNRVQLYT